MEACVDGACTLFLSIKQNNNNNNNNNNNKTKKKPKSAISECVRAHVF